MRAAAAAPWHPGRCAALHVAVSGATAQRHEWLAGHAGELHPRVIAAYGLPPRTCAFELDFAVLAAAAAAAEPVRGPALSAYPLATQDVALVVPEEVPAAEVAAALTAGAGELLEDVRLFDVYTGAQLGPGPQVPGLHAAAARARPDADRRRGDGRPRRRGDRGGPPHGRGPARVSRRHSKTTVRAGTIREGARLGRRPGFRSSKS